MEYRYDLKGFPRDHVLAKYRRVNKYVSGRLKASYGVMIPTGTSVSPVIYVVGKAQDTGRKFAKAYNPARNTWGQIVSVARKGNVGGTMSLL